MQSASVCTFQLILLLSLIFSIFGNFRLNIVTLPPWNDTLYPMLTSQYVGNIAVNAQNFDVGSTRSDYEKVKKAVDILRHQNTHVVIGPFDVPVCLATEALNITYIAMTEVTLKHTNCTFQLMPKQDDFSEAILDMVVSYKWEQVSVFFDDDKGEVETAVCGYSCNMLSTI